MTNDKKRAGYLALHEQGELRRRADLLRTELACCRLCPRACGVNRLAGEQGFCRSGVTAKVAAWQPHFGEESCLVGCGGSGTIFFSNCNLGCVFCQNETISHGGEGVEVDEGRLAAIMVSLQRQGCHNINLVTPTHVIAQIVAALPLAVERGLSVPLVYNSSGYDRVETLQRLEGVVDIYMPDCKFAESASASRYASAPDYPLVARQAIGEMHRQVGELECDETGVATRGLLVRHLVMPEGVEEAGKIMHFLASLSERTFVNVMEQYRPLYRAAQFPPIDRPLQHDEYLRVLELARQAGLQRLEESGFAALLRKLSLS